MYRFLLTGLYITKKTELAPVSIAEEWTGTLSDKDYKAFVSEIIETCKFRSLPEKVDEPIRIKDSSFDDISVLFNSKKRSIGGYRASHYEKYKCVYSSYNKMLFLVKNLKYKVKPKS